MKWKSVGVVAGLFVLTLLAGCSLARMGALGEARQAMRKGECAKAISKAADASDYGTPSPSQEAEILFIRAYCAERMKDTADAVGLYRFLKDHHSETAYGYQATEHLRALERKGDKSKVAE